MKRLLLIVLPLLFMVGCGKNGLHTEYYENGKKKGITNLGIKMEYGLPGMRKVRK